MCICKLCTAPSGWGDTVHESAEHGPRGRQRWLVVAERRDELSAKSVSRRCVAALIGNSPSRQAHDVGSMRCRLQEVGGCWGRGGLRPTGRVVFKIFSLPVGRVIVMGARQGMVVMLMRLVGGSHW